MTGRPDLLLPPPRIWLYRPPRVIPAPAAAESPGADALSDVLEAVRLTGALFFIVEASPPWIAEAPDSSALAPVILPRVQHVVSYHVVTQGTCWCHMAGAAPVRLDAGDVDRHPPRGCVRAVERPGHQRVGTAAGGDR